MRKTDFSFPAKITALVITVVVVPLVVYLASRWGKGTVIFTSSTPQAFIIDPEQGTRLPVPARLTKSAGKHLVTFAAPGYAPKTEKVGFPTLRMTKQMTFSLVPEFYNEDDRQSVAKVPLAAVLPYSEDRVFDMAFPSAEGVYRVTLQANRAWYASEASYEQALVAAQTAALKWIRSEKVDPSKLKIEWLPYDPSAKK